MTQLHQRYTDTQLAHIITMRRNGHSFPAIAKNMSYKFGIQTTDDSMRRAFDNYQHLFEIGNKVETVKLLQETARVKIASAHTARHNRALIERLNLKDDLISEIHELVASLPATLGTFTPLQSPDDAQGMTVEVLISDVHVGKVTSTFNAEVCRRRLQLLTRVLISEIERKSAHYNVERIIVGLLGDMIENALMHGRESQAVCEFNNPEQVRAVVDMIFVDVLTPLARLGIPLDVVCVGGNHDREDEKPTYNDPTKNGLGWIIYHVLKALCDQAGIKANWHIPEGVYVCLSVYGDMVLYEHGDRIKGGNTKVAFKSHMAQRSSQMGYLIKFLRLGHWHEYSCYDNGAIIVNASVPGQDSYAEVNGYNSVAGQAVTFYVNTKNRDNSYFHTVLIQLGGVV